jgi:hypothetical protein
MSNDLLIAQYIAHRLELVKAWKDVGRNIREVEQKLGALVTGIEIGDTISYAHGHTNVRRRAKVVGFEFWTGIDTWALWVTSIRRDGSEGPLLRIYPYQAYRKEVSE